MTLRYQVLDVFTQTRLQGNPLAVVLDADSLSNESMQAIAAEFNLSETVFLCASTDPAADVRARIFTPTSELPFAGHPTIGAAVCLAQLKMIADWQILIQEGVGNIPVSIKNGEFAELSVKVAPQMKPAISVELAAELLAIDKSRIVTSSPSLHAASCGLEFLLIEVNSRETLSQLSPHALTFSSGQPYRQIYAYWRDQESGNICARMFAPELGVAEDPATGSAAAALTGALALTAAGEGTDSQMRFSIFQGEDMGRPSEILCTADVTVGKVSSLKIGGYACVVMHGEITV